MSLPSKKVEFCVGDKVEVCSREDGFIGSYYEATIVQHLDNGLYMVRYKNLLEEDESKPLTDTVDPIELRPLPPRLHVSEFKPFQAVDAFDNDGWWAGNITGRRDSNYDVYFTTTNEHIEYPSSKIRLHHDWENGEWRLLSYGVS